MGPLTIAVLVSLVLALTVIPFGHVMRVLLGYASVMIFAGLTVTFSRGGWVAAAASLAHQAQSLADAVSVFKIDAALRAA